jgi:DUF971 family protein
MTPVKIWVENKNLLIKWDDNSESAIKLANLRMNCPCVLCVSEREGQSSSYIPIYSDEQIGIKNINIVGNYALGINWKDEHNTGIYTFEQLKNIAV